MSYFWPRDLGLWGLTNVYIGNQECVGKKYAGVPNPMKSKSMNSFTNPSSIIFSLFLLFLNIFLENILHNLLTLSWQRPLSYKNQSIDLLCKSMNWFLYDNDLRHERVKSNAAYFLRVPFIVKNASLRIKMTHQPNNIFLLKSDFSELLRE